MPHLPRNKAFWPKSLYFHINFVLICLLPAISFTACDSRTLGESNKPSIIKPTEPTDPIVDRSGEQCSDYQNAAGRNAANILIVMDDSQSTRLERALMRDGVVGMIDALRNESIEQYEIGVTTTTLLAHLGSVVGNLLNQDSSIDEIRTTLDLPTGSAPEVFNEFGVLSAWSILQEPPFRTNASLFILFVSDEDDSSYFPHLFDLAIEALGYLPRPALMVDDYLDFFYGLTGVDGTSINAIVHLPNDPHPCIPAGQADTPGRQYKELIDAHVARGGKGEAISLCDSDWTPLLNNLVIDNLTPQRCFTFDSGFSDDQLTVRMHDSVGTVILADQWEYTEPTGEVCFSPGSLPAEAEAMFEICGEVPSDNRPEF